MTALTVIRTDRGQGEYLVISVVGDLDTSTAPRLRACLTELIEAGHRHLVVEMAGVEFCDSRGLAVLMHLWRRLRDQEGTLVLVGLTDQVARVIDISGLRRILRIHSTVAEALTAETGVDAGTSHQPSIGTPADLQR